MCAYKIDIFITSTIHCILCNVYCTMHTILGYKLNLQSIVNAGKTAHFLLNFTLNKIKLVQIMNNRVYFVRNTCYFDVQ